MKELTDREIATITTLCNGELAVLQKCDLGESAWCKRVKELAETVDGIVKGKTYTGTVTAGKRPIAQLHIADSNMNDAIAGVGAIMETLKDGEKARIDIFTTTVWWNRFLARVVGLGYALSVEHDGGSLYVVTFYKGGAL